MPDPTLDEQRREVVALVPPTVRRVLDLGCSTGGVAWALRKTLPLVHVTGVDADERVREVASTRVDEFHSGDLNSPAYWWRSQPWYRPNSYDAIICADILEHLIDPYAVVGLLRELLSPQGVIVASVPQFRNCANLYSLIVKGEWKYHVHGKDHWRGPPDNVLSWGHLRMWTRDSISALFTDAGYVIERWAASYMSAPSLDGFTRDLAHLVQTHGGDPEAFVSGAHVIQYLVVARPVLPTSPYSVR